MVGAPISFSGNQPAATGTNPTMNPDITGKYAPPSHMYATPSASISTLLPYNGQAPPGAATTAPYPATTPAPSETPFNASYPYPPNPASFPFPPNPPASAPPPPFPPFSTAPPSQFPPCSTSVNTYPPNSATTSTAYPPVPSAPLPFSGACLPNSGLNQAPAYPSAQTTPAYPPAGYPPQPSNSQAPSGYPTGQTIGSYPPPTSTYPQAYPTTHDTPYSAAYPTPPATGGGVYPRPY